MKNVNRNIPNHQLLPNFFKTLFYFFQKSNKPKRDQSSQPAKEKYDSPSQGPPSNEPP